MNQSKTDNINSYETVIGLEVHIQLNTISKAFAADDNSFILSPNEHISSITLALPGTLPKANNAHIEKALKLCIALESSINKVNYFDRKNYFYPDLPKGYQITQDKKPIGIGGQFSFYSEGMKKNIRIHHLHMEEDAGKSNHEIDSNYSLIEYNRAGTPLIELVTEPDFRSGQEVHDFLAAIQQLVQYLDISDGNMEEGSIRCDCNVSVRPQGQKTYGERCEIKNINSKKFARQAITYEAQRQMTEINNGNDIHKTTMLFDTHTGTTHPMRKKETENDYRYFPEPDLCPMHISDSTIDKIKSELDYLPWTLKEKILNDGIQENIANILTESKHNGLYYLNLSHKTNAKELSDLMANKLIPIAIEKSISIDKLITESNIIEFINLITKEKINKANAYTKLLPHLIEKSDFDVEKLAVELNLIMEDNQAFLDALIEEVLKDNPAKLKEYNSGKKGLIGFFMGQVKLKAGNNINPQILKDKLEKRLG
jgi:aspartyl-tRNA(Asn)/glutamyl-tRNA(Gln) amidotransferase subunit B